MRSKPTATVIAMVVGSVTAALAGALVAGAVAESETGRQAATDAAEIRSHVEVLADDLLEGRLTGTRGYDLAALYAASRFRSAGLVPAAKDGTFLQRVPMLRADAVAAGARMEIVVGGRPMALEHGVEFLALPHFGSRESSITAPAVFVGFGIGAPELGYDDFRRIDVAGKIAVFLTGAPASFPPDARAFYTAINEKRRMLVEHGAVGAIAVNTPVDLERFPWERAVQLSWQPQMRWLDGTRRPVNGFNELRAAVTLGPAGAERLFEHAPVALNRVFEAATRGAPPHFAFPGEVSLKVTTEHTEVITHNVLAKIEGSDPSLADGWVVLTAHLDHLGVGQPVAGDAIYNGAYDNAMGSAVLMEIARAMGKSARRPRRTILFALVTGEERGLLGSDFLARNPPVARSRYIANINIDGPLFLSPLREVVVYGGDHSSIGKVAEPILAKAQLRVSPDPAPAEVIFVRSDHYSFVRQGVPALFMLTGPALDDPADASSRKAWRRTNYHQPSDDARLPVDWPSAARFADVNLEIARELADSSNSPVWNVGDFFGDKFGKPSGSNRR